MAYYPGTAADVRTSAEFNQDTYRASFSIPTELEYYNTGELNPGDRQGGLYVFIDRKTDGSGRLTLSSAEGEYFGNNDMQDTNYAVELGVTQKAMDAAAKDGILDKDDLRNILSDKYTLLTGVRITETDTNGVEIVMHNKSISIDPKGEISAKSHENVFDNNGTKIDEYGVIPGARTAFYETVANVKNSFDRQAAK